MIERRELEPVFQAWYDYRMEPDDPELLRVHHATLDTLKGRLEAAQSQPVTRIEVRLALRAAFSRWMKDNGLPKPPTQGQQP